MFLKFCSDAYPDELCCLFISELVNSLTRHQLAHFKGQIVVLVASPNLHAGEARLSGGHVSNNDSTSTKELSTGSRLMPARVAKCESG